MSVSEEAFEFLIQAYFHQDWMMDGPTPEAVLRTFVADSPPEIVDGAREYAAALVRSNLDEAELERTLDGFGIQIYPPGLGMTHRQWLELVDRLLTRTPPKLRPRD
jgi:contact-dependent growth inhibition (CDI) system CdiI-like immunity protein